LSAEAEPQPPPPAEAAPRRQRESRSRVDVLARHSLAHGGELCISAGSVLDFGGQTDWPPATMAIVNAANCGGLGGGGVDGAITAAGGPELAAHRRALPILEGTRRDRIATGGAVLTGPGDYGRLFAANVIHAVGPNYLLLRGGPGQTLEDGDAELSEAYAQTMSAAAEAGIEYIGFSLLSAGIFRGPRSLAHVLQLGLEAVCNGAYAGLKEVHLVAFQPDEQQTLQNLLLQMKAAAEPEPEPEPELEPEPEPNRPVYACSPDLQLLRERPQRSAAQLQALARGWAERRRQDCMRAAAVECQRCYRGWCVKETDFIFGAPPLIRRLLMLTGRDGARRGVQRGGAASRRWRPRSSGGERRWRLSIWLSWPWRTLILSQRACRRAMLRAELRQPATASPSRCPREGKPRRRSPMSYSN